MVVAGKQRVAMTALVADVSDSRKTRVSSPRVAGACCQPTLTLYETNERKLNTHHVTIDWALSAYYLIKPLLT